MGDSLFDQSDANQNYTKKRLAEYHKKKISSRWALKNSQLILIRKTIAPVKPTLAVEARHWAS